MPQASREGCPFPPTPRPETVVLVHPESTGLELARSARARGCEVVAVYPFPRGSWDRFQSTGELACPPWERFRTLFGEVLFCEDVEEMVSRVRSLPDVVAVVPGSEMAVDTSDHVASRLGLICNDPATIPQRRNKVAMKIAARARGLATADFSLCLTEAELEEFMAACSFPFVLKTPEGLGTADVHICRSPREGRAAFDAIRASRGIMGHKAEGALAESFLRGDEYAVNLFVQDGECRVVDVWKYRKVEGPHGRSVYHSDKLVVDAQTRHPELVDYAVRLADAVGIVVGPAHAEIKLTPDRGPAMVEIGSRLAGTHARMASRFSDFDLVGATIAAYSGRRVEFPRTVRFRKHCRIANCINRRSGVVRGIAGIEDILGLPSYAGHGLYVREGDGVTPTTDLINVPMIVELAHEREEQVALDLERVHQLFDLRVESA